MNTRNISSFLNKTLVTTAVTAACGAIGAVEGAISGATGAAILSAAGYAGHNIAATALAASAGVGLLAVAEGIALGALAVNGMFGTAEDMEAKGYKRIDQRIYGYVGYTANQVVGGVIGASLTLAVAGHALSFGGVVADVAIGAALTGLVITPLVTAVTVYMLAKAYEATRNVETPEPELSSNRLG